MSFDFRFFDSTDPMLTFPNAVLTRYHCLQNRRATAPQNRAQPAPRLRPSLCPTRDRQENVACVSMPFATPGEGKKNVFDLGPHSYGFLARIRRPVEIPWDRAKCALGCGPVIGSWSTWQGLTEVAGSRRSRSWVAAFIISASLFLNFGGRAFAADGDHKRVMILHSVGREFRPWNVYAKDIRAELDRQSRWPIDVQEICRSAARSGDPRPEELFLEYIKALYADAPPDLIISVGAPSAAFFQRHRKDLFPATPIVFTVLGRSSRPVLENDRE